MSTPDKQQCTNAGFVPLPLFLDVRTVRCLVVGGGNVAVRKVCDLIECGARPVVVAENPLDDIHTYGSSGEIDLHIRRYRDADLDGMSVVFAATDDTGLNASIARNARKLGILVNAVDDPEYCTFFSSAVVKRGALRIAVSTSGAFPALAASIRHELEERFSEQWGAFIDIAGTYRRTLIDMHEVTDATRMNALRWLASREAFDLFQRSGKERIWSELMNIISS